MERFREDVYADLRKDLHDEFHGNMNHRGGGSLCPFCGHRQVAHFHDDEDPACVGDVLIHKNSGAICARCNGVWCEVWSIGLGSGQLNFLRVEARMSPYLHDTRGGRPL